MSKVRISKSDDLQYVVEIRHKDGWKTDGYYRTLSGACKGALEMSGPSGNDIAELKKSLAQAVKDVTECVRKLSEKGQLTMFL